MGKISCTRQSIFREKIQKKFFIETFIKGMNLILKTINPLHKEYFQEAIEFILQFLVQ